MGTVGQRERETQITYKLLSLCKTGDDAAPVTDKRPV